MRERGVGCLWHDYQGEPCLITHGFRYHFIGRMSLKGGSANNVRLHIHVTDTWCVSVALKARDMAEQVVRGFLNL